MSEEIFHRKLSQQAREDMLRGSEKSIVVSIEGYDNAGKTTFIKALKKMVECLTGDTKFAYKVHVLSPGDTESGKKIRQHYKNKDEISKEEELKLHMASIDELDPILQQSHKYCPIPRNRHIYIIDRYVDSTICYQLAGNMPQEPETYYQVDGHTILIKQGPFTRWYTKKRHYLDYTLELDLTYDLYLYRSKKANKIKHPQETDRDYFDQVTEGFSKMREYTKKNAHLSRAATKSPYDNVRQWLTVDCRDLSRYPNLVIDQIGNKIMFGNKHKYDWNGLWQGNNIDS